MCARGRGVTCTCGWDMKLRHGTPIILHGSAVMSVTTILLSPVLRIFMCNMPWEEQFQSINSCALIVMCNVQVALFYAGATWFMTANRKVMFVVDGYIS